MQTDLSGRRTLVVEDEYFIADEIAASLRQLGAEIVGPVGTMEQALRILGSGQPVDLAVLDLNLHGKTTFDIADALVSRGIPFVFATGYDSPSLPAQYRDVPRWEKPFDTDALARALAAM